MRIVLFSPPSPNTPTPPPAAPVISAVSSGTPSTTGATITWTTDIASTSQVAYGPTSSYGSTTTLDSSTVTSHSVNITGLTASHTYHYSVLSTHSGTPAASPDATFATAATAAPVISSIVGTPADTTATITWTTDIASDSQVVYGLDNTYGSSTTLDPTAVTSHSVGLTGLSASTGYHYAVKSGATTSSDQTLTTTSGSFSPTDLAGLQVWYTTPIAGKSNTDPVHVWPDSSGNGNDMTFGGTDPVYVTSSPADLVSFAGVSSSGSPAITWSAGYSVYVATAQSFDYPPQMGLLTNSIFEIRGYTGSSLGVVFGTNPSNYSVTNDGGAVTAFHVNALNAPADGVDCKIAYNGVYSAPSPIAGGDTCPGGSTVLQLSYGLGGTEYWGAVGEVLVYSPTLSPTDDAAVQNYLLDRWGL